MFMPPSGVPRQLQLGQVEVQVPLPCSASRSPQDSPTSSLSSLKGSYNLAGFRGQGQVEATGIDQVDEEGGLSEGQQRAQEVPGT